MTTWDDPDHPHHPAFGFGDWLRILRRGLIMGVVTFGGLILLLLVRLIERPIWGQRRPWTPWITQGVCRLNFVILGMSHQIQGAVMRGAGAIVANHTSWLDIFALNARKRIYFVSKAEVAHWPGIGWLARSTGTVFIRRDPRQAREHIELFKERLALGHKLLFFPEGTSTDGQRVLPFKPTLFAAFLDPDLSADLSIQPVTLIYRAADGQDPRQYGWWGDMEFGPHLLSTLAAKRHGSVTVVYHPPVRVSAFTDRKVLAKTLEDTVRSGFAADAFRPLPTAG